MAKIKLGLTHLSLLIAVFCIRLDIGLPVFFNVGSPSLGNLNKVKFIYYYGQSVFYNHTFTLQNAGCIVTHPKFRLAYKTVVYMHGYSDGANNRSVKSVANAYIRRGRYNVIAMDYPDLVAEKYFREALPNTIQIGPYVANVILQWFDKGLDDSKLHLIGHSLGAHLAGVIGRDIIRKTNNRRKVYRITGLDPAGPGFYVASNVHALEAADATFVDNIHTDAPFFGAACPSGHVDFWPNFPSRQPGCPDRENSPGQSTDLCSHTRVWRLWVESVLPRETPFYAVSTKNWLSFRKNDLNLSNVVIMGEDTPPHARGDYYLQTNGKYPYSRGQQGVMYRPKT